MIKLFIDNDVILDILLERDEFKYSAKVFEIIESKNAKGLTSPIVFTNTFFLVSKAKNRRIAWKAIRKIKNLFGITNLNEQIVNAALTSDFQDFEDALQYYSALESKADYLVTRNKKDYQSSQLPIISPQEAIGVYLSK